MAKKKIVGEDGKTYYMKEKKPIYKRVWFWILIIFVIGGIGGILSEEDENAAKPAESSSSETVKESTESVESSTPEKITNTVASNEPAEAEPAEAEEVKIEEEPEGTETVSREFRNALDHAKSYLEFDSFSKQGLYDQLLFEDYPEDAAQYAVDNLNVDWNSFAVDKAISYLEYDSFSDQGLYDQLIFEGFTAEQAQYAIDNLPE